MDKAKYWLDLAKEDLDVAQVLFDGGKLLYSGFMCHLAVEKALKAKIENVGDTPQKFHNLIRLAEMGGALEHMNADQAELLTVLNPLQIEARYPAYKQAIESVMTSEDCAALIQKAREMVTWIEQRL